MHYNLGCWGGVLKQNGSKEKEAESRAEVSQRKGPVNYSDRRNGAVAE